MKFACLVFAYKDPEQLKRTVIALGDMDIFIHVDAKSDILPFKKIVTGNNVRFVEDREFVCWGGYSQVEALKRLMQCLVNNGKQYDRVIVVTALDYPVKQSRALEDYFSSDANKNFITTINITKSNNKDSLAKIQKYWFYDIKITNYNLMRIVRKICNLISTFLYMLHLLRKRPTITVGNEVWEVYFGSESCCLTMDCFMYVFNVIHNKPEVERYFKYSFAPIELILATIISNSRYKATIKEIDSKDYSGLASVSPLYYMEYDEAGGTGMKILTEDDFSKIVDSGKPFCRKVLSTASNALEDKIDNMNRMLSK